MRIAILSYADTKNYGDAMFPLVLENEIKKRLDAEVDFVTNTPAVIDGKHTVVYNGDTICNYDAVILAGGETIHHRDHVWIKAYDNLNKTGELSGSPSFLPFDWVTKKIKYKAWLSVGIFTPVTDYVQSELSIAESSLDFFSVRGLLAKKAVDGDFHKNTNIKITPDLGWLFPRYLNEHDEIRKNVFLKTHLENFIDAPYIAVQVNIANDEQISQISLMLERIQRTTGISVILVPIVRPWNDYEIMEKLRDKSNVVLLPNNLTYRETGAVLAGAEAYCGNSMHGAVTAMSFGKPSGVIHPFPMTKFQDLFGMSYHPEYFKNSWNELENLTALCLKNKAHLTGEYKLFTEYAQALLDNSLDTICEEIMKSL